ncbi:PEP-CTERM sorting domain-containing protein [Rubritalea tangerina]|uniref:PEP-CTERM sorting domain-containing protein n=1 Tax=Rubritalea tangerina TaxID=430798 RepID=A0ABW4ZDK7_9BACT
MQSKRTQWTPYLVVGGISLLPSAFAATLFTFDGFSNNENIADTYGDNATVNGTGFTVSNGSEFTGTPNIDISWQAAGQTQFYNGWDGRGSVAQLDQHDASWNFATSTGNAVQIISFDLDEWAGGGTMDVDWSITGSSSGLLASGNWTRSTGGRDTISPNVTGASGETLTLTFALNSGTASYVAVDNLLLDQVSAAAVPEPSTSALIGLGVGAMAMRRRRK